MNTDIQQAIDAEKTFNNISNLLLTFHQHKLNEKSIKKLHKSVKNVHILEPELIPKIRYIIELKDISEAKMVRDAILRSHYRKEYLTIRILENSSKNNNNNIDPFKLHVEDLPISVTDREIKQLYPLCNQYTFVKSDSSNSKSILVHFNNIKDSILAYKITNRISLGGNYLKVKFFRNENQRNEEFIDEENTDSEDDVARWEKIETNCLENREVSSTLYVKNFPLETTEAEILELFPKCSDYKFFLEDKSKSVFVYFKRTEDAVDSYTVSNNIFKSNILQIEFYHKNKKKSKRLKSERRIEDNDDKEATSKESNSNSVQVESETSEARMKNKDIDSSVLHVENLPLETTNEDLIELFPELEQSQIIPDKNTNTSAAYICFNSPFKAMQAFAESKNIFNRKKITVKFKTKNLKLNPFAFKRKATVVENSDKRVKSNSKPKSDNNKNDDLILIDEVPNNNLKIISEDDIECESENEDYADDIFAGVVDLEEDEIDNEDNISEENDFQGMELDDVTVLPLDEDDFSSI